MDDGGCWSPWVTAEVTSVVADMCWATSHGTMWVQLTTAGLMGAESNWGTFSGVLQASPGLRAGALGSPE